MIAALLALAATAAPPPDDVVRKALTDEMARTMKELQLPNEPRPYQVLYSVIDIEQVSGSATFGAALPVMARRQRVLRAELRVGDRTFDSGNFIDAGGGFGGALEALPLDDDYLTLRRVLWLKTDELFKSAVRLYGRKRASEKAQAHSDEDTPFDYAEAKVAQVAWSSDGSDQKLDGATLARLLTELSAVFRDTPAIHSSQTGGEQVIVRHRLLTSDGSWKDERRSFVELVASAETQADDGMVLRSWSAFQGATLQGLPSLEAMKASVKAMAAELAATRKAPPAESGNAVVLFEGRAGGQIMRRLLGDQLSGTPPARTSAGRSSTQASDLVSKLGQRIAPPFLDAYDDPLQTTGPGKTALFGAYQVDDEGVPAERVSLVKKGMLESLLMSRTPRKELTRSNGHGRGRALSGAVRGRVGVLFVSAGNAALSEAALRARAVKEAKAGNMPLYIVRQADAYSGSGVTSARPTSVVRLRDGKEEPVRGLAFQNLPSRTLKDIVALGKQPAVHNFLDGQGSTSGAPGSVVCPSVLIKDVEVKKDTSKHPRPPLYPHPAFAEK